MLLQAASDFNIDLKSSWMIGDGISAGCSTALISDAQNDYGQIMTKSSLYECVKELL